MVNGVLKTPWLGNVWLPAVGATRHIHQRDSTHPATRVGSPHAIATMCIYYYLHYHHVAPCKRDIDYSLQYDFCQNATTVPSIPSPSSPITNSNSRGNRSASASNAAASSSSQPGRDAAAQEEYVQQPCASLTYASDYSSSEMIDYNNPCATGGCLLSSECTSGQCRLEDLGGRWVCCHCCRGGNTFRWCAHPMRKVPDTMCYHKVCEGCWADS